MNRNEQVTLGGVFLGLGGQILYLVGSGAISVGALYAVHRISSVGVRGLELLPEWITPANPASNENQPADKALITRDSLKREVTAYAKICGTIVAGVMIKYAGAWLSRDSTVLALNNILYRREATGTNDLH